MVFCSINLHGLSFISILSMNNLPWINTAHHFSESGTQVWHVNLALHWKSKLHADSRRNLQSCWLLAPPSERGETDQFKVTSLSANTADDQFQTPHISASRRYLHICFFTSSSPHVPISSLK
jgi:hypothetical protein